MEAESTVNGQTILIEPENKLPPFTIEDLPPNIADAARGLGWNSLMPVQSVAIPYLLADRDMIVQSRTGSGKTGAFLIPLLMNIDPAQPVTQALILVPARELASQVFRAFESLTGDTGLRGALVYGGVGYGPQLQSLRDGAHIVIGTPGRVLDLLSRRSMSLDRLRTMIFDEADEMLSMGFYPAMRELRRYLPRERRSWMFSATMPYKVQSLAEEFLHKPEFLSLSAGQEAVSTAEHRYYLVPAMEKDIILMRLIEMENPESAIVFCNTKSEVEFLSAALKNHGYNADQLSGDLDQKERELAMQRIRTRETRFLVATDVAARGIDISDLAYVFQYDVPKDPEPYLHRAGRTARAGNTGVVVTLVGDMSERTSLKRIARKYSFEFVEMPTPTEEDVELRISERMIVLLEERMRTRTRRADQLRMKRFAPLVQTLAESEEERLLLGLLLDDLYHEAFHAAPPAPQAAPLEPQRRTQSSPAPRQPVAQKGAQQGAQQGGQQSAQQGSQQSAQQGSQQGAEVVDDEAAAKKKKKRRRGKRGAGGPNGGSTEGLSEPS